MKEEQWKITAYRFSGDSKYIFRFQKKYNLEVRMVNNDVYYNCIRGIKFTKESVNHYGEIAIANNGLSIYFPQKIIEKTKKPLSIPAKNLYKNSKPLDLLDTHIHGILMRYREEGNYINIDNELHDKLMFAAESREDKLINEIHRLKNELYKDKISATDISNLIHNTKGAYKIELTGYGGSLRDNERCGNYNDIILMKWDNLEDLYNQLNK